VEALTLFSPNFDGTGEALSVFKLEGQEGVGDLRLVGFEVFEDKPNFADLVQAHLAFDPPFIEVLRGPPCEITDVFQLDDVPVEVGSRQPRVVVHPISFVLRLFEFEPAHGDHQPHHEEYR
jgi:hypothetical protein